MYRWFVRGGGLALIAVFGVIGRIDDVTGEIPLFLALYAGAFAVYAGAVFVVRRAGGGAGRGLLAELFIVAVVCRVLLLPAAPSLSTDVYRYIWEGRLVANGSNPFVHAPDSEELAHLRDRHHDRINHEELATIYPPVAQAVFALGVWVSPEPYGQKALFILFDLAIVLVLIALLRARGRDPVMSVVYAWNPLVIVEVAHSGHLEPIGVFFLVAGLLALERGRRAAGAVALALSFLAKYTSVLIAPFLLVRRRMIPWVGVAALVVVLGYLPFAAAGTKLISSLEVYGRGWYFNGAIYSIVVLLWNNPDAVRLVLAGILLATVVAAVAREEDVTRYAFVTIGAALLLAPTLYPWYVCWIIPLLCIHFNRAWVLLTGLIFASYWVWVDFAAGGEWLVRPGVMVLEFLPFYSLLVFDALRRRETAADDEHARGTV